MKITIDTKQDTKEEIKKIIKLLISLVGSGDIYSNESFKSGGNDLNERRDIFSNENNSDLGAFSSMFSDNQNNTSDANTINIDEKEEKIELIPY